jgi:chromate transporter
MAHKAASDRPRQSTPLEVLRVFLKLGLTSFGGPMAHLGYFREEFVGRRKWLEEADFADLIALCQFLPGPASSQVGLAIGFNRAGYAGALAAWIGFTLPSALALVLFAFGAAALGNGAGSAWLHGLMIAAVAVVAQAVLGMMRVLAPDRSRATIAVAAAVIALALPPSLGQLGAICAGALAGFLFLRGSEGGEPPARRPRAPSRTAGALALLLFFALLLILPFAATLGRPWEVFAAFYRSGALVFGGGHVVLPLLQAEVVPRGWVGTEAFLAGYGAAQAVPGPLFAFAAYLGAVIGGWSAAAVCLIAIYLPSFLLVTGVLPFWARLQRDAWALAGLRGVNAAVVGLLLAALYQPVWTAAIGGPADFALAIVAFLALFAWRAPPWQAVILCAAGAALLAALR